MHQQQQQQHQQQPRACAQARRSAQECRTRHGTRGRGWDRCSPRATERCCVCVTRARFPAPVRPKEGNCSRATGFSFPFFHTGRVDRAEKSRKNRRRIRGVPNTLGNMIEAPGAPQLCPGLYYIYGFCTTPKPQKFWRVLTATVRHGDSMVIHGIVLSALEKFR